METIDSEPVVDAATRDEPTEPAEPAITPGAGELDGPAPFPPFVDRMARRVLAIRPESLITLVIVGGCALFVLQALWAGGALFDDTIVTGGDMGAHYWAPAYLRDHLLPAGRLSGWAPDWFGGFPVFQFYMVVPMLAIVLLNVGDVAGIALLSVAVLAVMAVRLSRRDGGMGPWKGRIIAAVIVILLLGVGLPYGVAFKLVVICGLVSMPVSAWAMGRMASMPFPGPPLLAVATLFFVFDRSFHILGGNGASTMAGEFAFSISLSLALLSIGLFIRGIDTGRGRGWAAIVLTLTGLCHVIPALFAAGVILIVAGLRFGRDQFRWLVTVSATAGLLTAFWSLPFVTLRTYMNDMGWEQTDDWQAALINRDRLLVDFLVDSPALELVLVFAVIGFGLAIAARNRLGVVLGLVVPALGIAFLYLGEQDSRLWNARITPFYYLSLYLLAAIALAEAVRLFTERKVDDEPRWSPGRFGFLALSSVVAAAFVAAPHVFSSLYDDPGSVNFILIDLDMLQLVYLATWFVLAVAVAEWARFIRWVVTQDAEQSTYEAEPNWMFSSGRLVRLAVPLVAFAFTWLVVGLPLGSVPFSSVDSLGRQEVAGITANRSFVNGWANYNFRGADNPERLRYPEYRDIIETAGEIGEERGCGRALWEYGPTQAEYGTPMAMMLLPHFSDGCIGSMEGLYFESSASTPHHFQMQSALSNEPSRPQRDLPYPDTLDIDLGVEMMQLYGVRYYFAYTPEAFTAASENDDLEQIAQSGPWTVFEVADSELVVALDNEPVVINGLGNTQAEWLGQTGDEFVGSASEFFLDPSLWTVFRTADGPDEWARVDRGESPPSTALAPVEITDISTENDEISFTVDQIGVPVLVKTSYFPNWAVSGADGPYRVQPNLMVVVPTSTEVTLTYERSGVEILGMLLTALGIGVVIGFFRTSTPTMSEPWFDPIEGLWFGIDHHDEPEPADDVEAVGTSTGSVHSDGPDPGPEDDAP